MQTVSDGPHGMCASTEVTVQWEGASEAVRLNGMAPHSSECSPSGVLWWKKTGKTTSKATVTPNDSAFVAQLTHYFTNVVEAPKSEARILQLATKYATNKVKLYAALKKKFGQPVPTPGRRPRNPHSLRRPLLLLLLLLTSKFNFNFNLSGLLTLVMLPIVLLLSSGSRSARRARNCGERRREKKITSAHE